jgi:hypothetical protein
MYDLITGFGNSILILLATGGILTGSSSSDEDSHFDAFI